MEFTLKLIRGVPVQGVATVGLSAVILRAANDMRRSVIVYNSGPGILYLGNSAVTVSNSPPIAVGGNLTVDQSNDTLYAVSTDASTEVRFFEEQNP
jgi:hypothetical protein